MGREEGAHDQREEGAHDPEKHEWKREKEKKEAN